MVAEKILLMIPNTTREQSNAPKIHQAVWDLEATSSPKKREPARPQRMATMGRVI